MRNILVKSQSILKNDMRSGTAKEFSAIWDFAQLCSFIRLEVMIKTSYLSLSRNQGNFSYQKGINFYGWYLSQISTNFKKLHEV